MSTRSKAARRQKGEGSIYWSERYQAWMGTIELPPKQGKRRRKTVMGETRKAVVAKLQAARVHRDRPADATPLGLFLDDWLLSRAVTELRQATRESYTDTLRLHVRPFLGDVPLSKLTPARLEDWLDELALTKRSVATIRYAKVVLRIALQRAVRRDLLSVNPVGVLRVKGGTSRAPTPLSASQVAALLEHATPWLRTAILIGALAGLRRGEICGLQWDDLSWSTGELRVQRSISAITGEGEPKTAAGRRIVPLPAIIVRALEGHRRRLEVAWASRHATRQLPPWIFAADNGKAKHPRNFLHAYEAARKKAGLPRVRFHDLRHTCATALISLGNDIKAVSQLLGHADVRTTLALYHHPDSALQRKGAASLQRWLNTADVPEPAD